MTIIFLTRCFYPQIGGVEIHVIEIGKRLVERGHKVIVITENSVSSNSNLESSINGIEVIRINAGKDDWIKKFRIWRQLFSKSYLLAQADVIHCHDVFFWYLPFRLLYLRKKVFITFHGYETKFPPRISAIIIRKISEKLSSENICVGDFIQKWYKTKPTFVSYGGVNVEEVQVSSLVAKRAKLKIVLIGRLERDIGVNTYLEALKILKSKKVKFNFQAIGEGALKKNVEKYGNVGGFINDISKLIKDSDIVFCSSYLTMLQALALKKIVIAVYGNKLKEDYLKLSPFAPFIYVCKDADEISQVVKSVQESPWKSNAMILNGYQWATQQTWDKVVKMYLELWKQ